MNINAPRSLKTSTLASIACTLMLAASVITSPTAIAQTKSKNIAYIAPDHQLAFWRYLAKGAEKTITESGGKMTDYDSHGDAAVQLKNAQDAIAHGVDGIILTPTDSSTAPAVLKIAEAAKIPVVIADIGTISGDYVAFVESENRQAGYAVGKSLAQLIKTRGTDKGGYGLVTVSLSRKIGKDRTDGFRESMKEAGIAEVGFNQMRVYSADETFKFVQDMLTAHPNIGAIFIETDTPAMGAVRAIQSAKKTDSVALAAFDGIPPFVKMLGDGSLAVLGAQQPFLMGQTAASTLLGHLSGKTVEKHIVLPIPIVTKDNLTQELPIIKNTIFGGEFQ
jgi:ribose transport system substrate-binding protein